MKGLILSGGKGTRLRPLTYTSAKQLVPVANKPVLFYGIEAMAEAGIRQVGLVGGDTAAAIEAGVSDGSRWGLEVTYIHQDALRGLAHAVLISEPYLGREPFVMYLATTCSTRASGPLSSSSNPPPRQPKSSSHACPTRRCSASWNSAMVGLLASSKSRRTPRVTSPGRCLHPLYGDGLNVRDWLHVRDHCRALDLVIAAGKPGEVYNVGGGNEVANIDLTRRILGLIGRAESLIRAVPDRLGHDRRYCLDTTRLQSLGWRPDVDFEDGMRETVAWYQQNQRWWRRIKEGDPAFGDYLHRQCGAAAREPA